MNLDYMQADLFSCSLCFIQFDGQARLPKLIPTCGHTLCITCLAKVIKTNRECPLDRIKFLNLPERSEEFPTNRLVLQVVDIKLNGHLETCNQHGKPKNLVCLRDHVQICEGCRPNHKDHSIKSVKEWKDQAQAQKKKLEFVIEDFTSKKEEVRVCIKDFRNSTRTILERGFNKTREILKQRENQIFSKLGFLLQTKEEEIEKVIEEDDRLKEKYDLKIADLNDLSSSLRFSKTLDKLEKKKMNPFKIDQVLNDLKLIKGRSIPALETLTHSLVSSIEKLDYDIMANTFLNVNEIGALNAEISNLETLLDVKMQGTRLMIAPRNSTSKHSHSHQPFALSLWKGATSFEVQFNEGDLTVEHFQALKKTYNHCANINTFCLEVKNKDFTDDHLIRFVSDPFWATDKSDHLKINFQTSQVSDRGLIKLITESFVKMLQVKTFHLIANDTKITDKSVRALAIYFTSQVINLEIFNLQLFGTKTTDSSIVELFRSMSRLMGSMKTFSLSLGSTQITDQSLVVFSQENLKLSANLEFLNLVLSRTNVTDYGFQIFCENAKNKLQKTKKFILSLAETRVTDQSISEFGNNVLPNMVSLSDLTISVSPNATDSSIKSLCGGLNNIIQNLEQSKLIFYNTKISDIGIQMITRLINLKSLPRLRVFDLVIVGTSVSDFTRGQIIDIKKQLSLRNKEN